MDNIITEEIKWIPITSDERPENYDEVLVVADRWSTIVDDWVRNSVLKTRWTGERFDICAPHKWAPEHMPKIKYWAFMPVGPVDPEQKIDYDYNNRIVTELVIKYPLLTNGEGTINDAIDFVYGPDNRRLFHGEILILDSSESKIGSMWIDNKTGALCVDPDGPVINVNIKILPKSVAYQWKDAVNKMDLALLINREDLAKGEQPNGEEH